jgi:uncharacterized protein YjbI with pentapeptide repeats
MLLSFSFQNCNLELSGFYKLRIPGTSFISCRLAEADFTEANLSNSDFKGSDLHGAIFDSTNLENADLSEAFHYHIDPDNNRIRKAKFSIPGIIGLLAKYDIEII